MARSAELDTTLLSLSSSSSVHDRTQFESKYDFDLLSDDPRCDRKAYEIDTYLFIPNSVGINSDTYKSDEFYTDLTHLMRVRTPGLERSPGQPLQLPPMPATDAYLLDSLEEHDRSDLHDMVLYEVKLLGCFLYSELKRLQGQVSRARGRKTLAASAVRFSRALESVHRELRRFRDSYMDRIREEEPLLETDVRRVFLLVDEYLSYRLEAALVHILELLGAPDEGTEDLANQCEALLLGELSYRQAHVGSGSSATETHYYRLSLLKKYVSEVLFLKTRRVSRDYLYRNMNAAMGASLAALFATFTQMQTARIVKNDAAGWQLVLLIALGVLLYAFKDRIKDLSKEHFNARLKRLLPDYDVQLSYPHFDAAGRRVESVLGESQEFCRYVGRYGLPPDIAFVRDMGHRSELEPDRLEQVVFYNKQLQLPLESANRDELRRAGVRRIHDVLRFDVSRFLAKLDNPRKTLTYFQPGQGVQTIEAPKVYHLNVIFRYTVTEWSKSRQLSQTVDVERIRLVINKKGIVRIESVLPRGELGYSH